MKHRPACSHAPILYTAAMDSDYMESIYRVDSHQTLILLLEGNQWDKALREFDGIIHRSLQQHLSETDMLRLLKNINLLLQRYGASILSLTDTIGVEEAISRIRAAFQNQIQQASQPLIAPADTLAAQALHYITDHLCDPTLSLLSVAEALHVSDSLLSKTIKNKLHMGYLDLVNSRRIELAKQIMVQESISIKDVATRVGYGNDITFRRLFKKFGGMLPTQYIAREPVLSSTATDSASKEMNK